MSRDVSNYNPLTLPATAPAPTAESQQQPSQALVTGASTIEKVPSHAKAEKAKVKSSVYEELKRRLAKREMPSEAMLDEAIKQGSLKSIKLLAAKGIDLDQQVGPDGNTRLHNACKAGDAKTVKLLLAGGASVRVDNDAYTPPSVLAFDLPQKDQRAVLRALAADRDGVIQIAAWAKDAERNDILDWLVAEQLISKSLLDRFAAPQGSVREVGEVTFTPSTGRGPTTPKV